MRKFLVFVGIICVTVGAKAQLFKKFKPGYYYDTSGIKHAGYISKVDPTRGLFKGKGDHIFYRPDMDAKNQKIETDQLKAVVIERDSMSRDSFVVSKYEDLEKYSFLKVILTGTTNPYVSTIQYARAGSYGAPGTGMPMYTAGGSYSKADYYYGPDPNHLTGIRRKNFIEAMSTIMADKPAVTDKIKSKYFRYGDMDELLNVYRTGIIKDRPMEDTGY